MGKLRGNALPGNPGRAGPQGNSPPRCQRRRRACNGRFADRRTDRTRRRRRLRPWTIPPPKIRTARRRPKRRSIGLHRRCRRRRRGLRWRCSLNALVKRGKCFLLPPPCNIASAFVAVAISQRTSPPLTSYKLCNSGLNLKKEAHDAAGHKTREAAAEAGPTNFCFEEFRRPD